MQSADNILFDLDGTLTDSQEGIVNCLAYALEKLGYARPPDEALMQYIGPPLLDTFGKLVPAHEVQTAFAFFVDRYDTQGKGLLENSIYPDIPRVLANLQKSGKRLFVATSKAEKIARRIIDSFNLAPYFHAVHGAVLDGTRPDKNAVIAHICSAYGIAPENTIMIGDRYHDIEGATHNKLRSIGVLWGYGSADELQKAGAAALAATPLSLLPLLIK